MPEVKNEMDSFKNKLIESLKTIENEYKALKFEDYPYNPPKDLFEKLEIKFQEISDISRRFGHFKDI